jgi:hypothetical protein
MTDKPDQALDAEIARIHSSTDVTLGHLRKLKVSALVTSAFAIAAVIIAWSASVSARDNKRDLASVQAKSAAGQNVVQVVADACTDARRAQLAQLGIPCAAASSVAAQPAPSASLALVPVPGPTGPAGPQGSPGASGPVGSPGPTGPSGKSGVNGVSVTGPPGANGRQGAPGPTGATGPQGVAGPAGADGAAGPAGVAGADGKDGTNGTDGTNGVDGQPPYSWTYSVGPRDFTCVRTDPFDAAKPTYVCNVA